MDAEDGRTKRLFVAVPMPGALSACVKRAQEGLLQTDGIRLLDSGQLHCTLAFIGDADFTKESVARRVVAGLDPSLGGEAVIDKLVCLPNARRAQVVALGIDDRAGVLSRLFETVMEGLEADEVMHRDRRPFRPHITIARLRRPGRVQPTTDCGRASFGVESVCLYASELKPGGAVHTEIERRLLQIA